MEPPPATPEQDADRSRGRIAFLSWFFALVGLGAAMLAFLLIGAGAMAWSSPIGVVLLALTALGLVCLAFALLALFRARRERRQGMPS